MITLKYRLIALDLDGTLLGSDHRISPRSRQALARAQSEGIHVTLASGRSYKSMQPWVRELNIVEPVISYQGSQVTDPRTDTVSYRRVLAPDIVSEATQFARSRGLSITIYSDDVIYVENKRHSDAFYDRWFGLPWRLVPDLVDAQPPTPIKFIIIGSGDELDRIEPEAKERFGQRIEVLRSHEYFLEGLGKGVTKGSALAWVANRLGIAQAETLAFGDAGNDVAMLRWAGLGVAMSNGSPEAKAAADMIAPSVDEDGVSQVISRLCFDGQRDGSP